MLDKVTGYMQRSPLLVTTEGGRHAEFYKLIDAGPHLLDLDGLLDRVEIVAHVVDAAARGRHGVIEAGEIADEQSLGIGARSSLMPCCRRPARSPRRSRRSP
jgi:hypothetical protein